MMVSLFPLALGLLLRWWHAARVLAAMGERPCRCDLRRWLPAAGDPAVVHRAESTASEFGRDLRAKAMLAWMADDARAARSREGPRRFGMLVPPLSAVIAILAVVVGKVPAMALFAAPMVATAVAVIFGLLALPAELAVIAKYAAKVRDQRAFPDRDDEDAVIDCALAHAWELAMPPVLRIGSR